MNSERRGGEKIQTQLLGGGLPAVCQIPRRGNIEQRREVPMNYRCKIVGKRIDKLEKQNQERKTNHHREGGRTR